MSLRTTDETPEYMTINDAAEHLRVSRSTIVRALADGSLRGKRLGPSGNGPYRIRRTACDDWFDGLIDS